MSARSEFCDTHYNLQCFLPFHRQHSPYHRLRECFVPLLARLREAWRSAEHQIACVCVQKGVLQPLLELLPARPMLHILCDRSKLLKHPDFGRGPARLMMEHVRRASFRRLVATHPRNLHWYLSTIGAGSGTGNAPARLVLMRRAGSGVLRKLTSQGWTHLLASTAHYERTVYWGNESLRETLGLFRGAMAVVGAHGAGAGNAIWCPGCAVVEIVPASPDVRDVARVATTARCYHNGSCHGGPWRSNGHVLTALNPQMRWSVAVLPLDQVCAANGLSARDVPSAREWATLHRNYGPAHVWYRTHHSLPLSRAQAERVATRLNDSTVPRGRLTFLGL